MNKQPMSIEISLAIVSSGSMNGGCTRERKSRVEFSSYFLVIPSFVALLSFTNPKTQSGKKIKANLKENKECGSNNFCRYFEI